MVSQVMSTSPGASWLLLGTSFCFIAQASTFSKDSCSSGMELATGLYFISLFLIHRSCLALYPCTVVNFKHAHLALLYPKACLETSSFAGASIHQGQLSRCSALWPILTVTWWLTDSWDFPPLLQTLWVWSIYGRWLLVPFLIQTSWYVKFIARRNISVWTLIHCM